MSSNEQYAFALLTHTEFGVIVDLVTFLVPCFHHLAERQAELLFEFFGSIQSRSLLHGENARCDLLDDGADGYTL